MGNWSPLGRQNGGPRRSRGGGDDKKGCLAVGIPDRWLEIDWRGHLTKYWRSGATQRRNTA